MANRVIDLLLIDITRFRKTRNETKRRIKQKKRNKTEKKKVNDGGRAGDIITGI